jgi:hypothetical protein
MPGEKLPLCRAHSLSLIFTVVCAHRSGGWFSTGRYISR